MSKSKAVNITEQPSVHLNFSRGNKPEVPSNFDKMKIGQDVIVTISGKVKSLSAYEGGDKNFGVVMKSVEVKIPSSSKSMSDVMEEIKEARRK